MKNGILWIHTYSATTAQSPADIEIGLGTKDKKSGEERWQSFLSDVV